ncbi:MAG: hypothetical protein A2V81_03715 [Candidatus Abawacabacteria bacterium RBG_16_42_10]|uniref:SLH domain-containing protein n=1 Tax=Candidatus Abawacabacteria bacterium RBG_16_42_10 TaxID=1817814 RepID=A0A1F4XK32_9BACT|nr:MAG: hypothetical protein A2V81_03715 [Candidatus Abawacabacteria bacterium RBG_16_42_10]
MFKRLLTRLAIIMVVLSAMPTAQAFIFIPLFFGPNVTMTSPKDQERIVFDFGSATSTRTIVVMFDRRVDFVGSASDAIEVTNTTDTSLVVPTSVEAFRNMLFFTSDAFTYSGAGKEYEAKIIASKVKDASTGTLMTSNYVWTFEIVNPSLFVPENSPRISVEKNTSTPGVTVGSTDETATYKITVTNNGEYDLTDLTIKDVLPPGFTFDSIVSASGISTSGTSIVTFTAGALPTGNSTIITFKAKVPAGDNSSSDPIVPAGTYHNSVMVYGHFVPTGNGVGQYPDPVVSDYDDNRESDEDVAITRSTPSPTPTPTPSPTSTAFPHPASDPLTCLSLGGATSINFTDVSGSDPQRPYIDFLSSTVFADNPSTRLSKGYTDGSFGVNNTLTRFELTKMALGGNCMNYVGSPAPNTFFNDVPKDNSEMSLVIGKAYAEGIVSGIGDRFYPNIPVTYGEMVKILVGAGVYFNHGTPVTAQADSLTCITDESFRQFAEHATRMNLVNLGPGNCFPQNNQVIRRYMAQAVARYIAWLKNITLP